MIPSAKARRGGSLPPGSQNGSFSLHARRLTVQSDATFSSHRSIIMNAMPVPHVIDPKPVLDLIEQKGGECSFDEALDALVHLGMKRAAARDGLWQLLSDGSLQ